MPLPTFGGLSASSSVLNVQPERKFLELNEEKKVSSNTFLMKNQIPDEIDQQSDDA